MTITIDAIYENGVFRPTEPITLQEHEKVRVTVESQADLAEPQTGTNLPEPARPSLAERIVALAHSLPPGTLDSLPNDLAAQHDQYLYGIPKRPE